MTKEGSTKLIIVNSLTPRVWVLMLGRGYISHYSEYTLSPTLYNIQHIDCCCIKGFIMLLSYAIVDFHLFYDKVFDIQI